MRLTRALPLLRRPTLILGILGCLLIVITCSVLLKQFSGKRNPPATAAKTSTDTGRAFPQSTEFYKKLPMSFEKNVGHLTPQVKFRSRGTGYSLFLTANEAVLALKPSTPSVETSPVGRRQAPVVESTQQPDVIRMKLLGANGSARIDGVDKLGGTANYFIGNRPANWRTGVPLYAKVRYRDVYPGIDLLYHGDGNQLEYDFVIAPGANPDAIRLDFSGTKDVRLDSNGNLVLTTGAGELRQKRPLIYQQSEAERKEVPGHFVISDHKEVSFKIDNYDSTKPLVIDPVLVYSTYLGGNSDEASLSVAIDGQGNTYVTGWTQSTDFPTSSPVSPTNSGASDIVITKLNPAGTGIVYSTYIGGAANDVGEAIAVNSAGEAFVSGYTRSTNLPVVAAVQPTYGGGTRDAFFLRLSPNGNSLVYSTYVGGNGDDTSTSIALNNAGAVYGTGYTSSTNFVTVNAIQSFNAGGFDAFVLELAPAGNSVVFSTYAGGSGSDQGFALALDALGFVYILGDTTSTNLPTFNALQPFYAGGPFDAFLAKLTPSGNNLVFSTYAGGNGDDSGQALAVDGSGNIYATGYTDSINLSLIVDAVQPNKGAGYDAYVAKLNSSGSQVLYSTFLGGNNTDVAFSVAVDSAGTAYVTGQTFSSDFPLVNPTQGVYGGAGDVFVTKLWPSGSTILFSTYIGGSGDDWALDVAVDQSGNAYLTGRTGSANFPTVNPVQATKAAGFDSFVAKLSTGVPTPGPKIAFASSSVGKNHDIYLMDPDGSNQVRITNNAAYDDQPAWSPDGNKIAFMSDRSGNFEIYSMNSDGTGVTKLTNNVAADGFPSWSPDGSKIVFVSGDLRSPDTFEIYLMNADGSNRTRLTNDAVIDGVPTWSPNGSRIVFMSGATNFFNFDDFEIFSMKPDGTNRIQLTSNTVMDAQPSYSPDGTKIVFASGTPFNASTFKIWVMNADGSNRVQLTNNSVTDGFPTWSHDGTKIIFSSGIPTSNPFRPFDETNVELYSINADGSNRVKLTNNSVLDWFPDWQPGAGSTSNPIDRPEFFVRRHYLDFLNRQPDAAGLNFWTNEISSCGSNVSCIEVKRINVSAAFFLSIEFQGTGYLVERLYKTAYGDVIGNSTFPTAHQLPVPVIRFHEFLDDSQQLGQGLIVGQPGWEQVLENNKQLFTTQFVQRSRFTAAFPTSMTAAQFVDTLNANAGGPLSPAERNQLVTDLSTGVRTRAQVLLAVAEDPDFSAAEFNRAFVLMQYFGYLRRNPNDLPDADYTGYDFWLTKLNDFGNFGDAEMVKAFIVSSEYKHRFGP